MAARLQTSPLLGRRVARPPASLPNLGLHPLTLQEVCMGGAALRLKPQGEVVRVGHKKHKRAEET